MIEEVEIIGIVRESDQMILEFAITVGKYI